MSYHREYFEKVATTTSSYQDSCFRQDLKRRNPNIIIKLDNDKKYIINSNGNKPMYLKIKDLEDKVDKIEKRLNVLEKKDTETKAIHILGQCISFSLFHRINNKENYSYEDWNDIPEDIYSKYGFNKSDISRLKKIRNNMCHPKTFDIKDMISHFSLTHDRNIILDIVDFIYDMDKKEFK